VIKFCATCLMPNSRPRIAFDENGTCNACHTAAAKAEIDWDVRREEFLELIEKHRGKGDYDCIVPWSGGKDSSSIAHKLKYEFGLNPLLVTFSPLMPTEVGVHNREALVAAGFDQLLSRPNQKVSQHLARRFFIERGNPKIHWDAGVNSAPIQAAVRYNIPLVFYAEHGESEYGGKLLSPEHAKMRDVAEVLEHQIGDHPSNWVDDEISERDLAPYIYPEVEDVARVGVKAMYFGYFFPWDVVDNFNYIRKHIDFRSWPGGHIDGTFTDYDSLDDKIDNLYYYMQMIKFGFGRASRDASRQIYRGRMTRDEAVEVARKFDEEFPKQYFNEHLGYLGLTEKEFHELVDKHRNPEIWKFEGNRWKLRYAPYEIV
jgi:N-acetyl sugar amidotransferase